MTTSAGSTFRRKTWLAAPTSAAPVPFLHSRRGMRECLAGVLRLLSRQPCDHSAGVAGLNNSRKPARVEILGPVAGNLFDCSRGLGIAPGGDTARWGFAPALPGQFIEVRR
jgi:hypothetical protein